MTAIYEELAELTERGRDLAAAGEFDAVREVHDAWHALAARLPEVPPAEARPALERAAAAQLEMETALRKRANQLAAEMRRLARGRRAIRGYARMGAQSALVDQAG